MIDTFTKRAAVIGAGLPWRLLLPAPDGEFDDADRYALLGVQIYGGDANPGDGLFVEIAESTNINATVGQFAVPISGTATTAAGTDIDLSDYGDLVWIIERLPPSRADVQVVNNNEIALSGDANSTASFVPAPEVISRAQDYKHALRQVSTGYVLMRGRITVRYEAMADA